MGIAVIITVGDSITLKATWSEELTSTSAALEQQGPSSFAVEVAAWWFGVGVELLGKTYWESVMLRHSIAAGIVIN